LCSRPVLPTASLLAREPQAVHGSIVGALEAQLFIQTTQAGKVSTEPSDTESGGRILSVQPDGELVHPSFLAAWLNSEQGVSSRRRAVESSSSGTHLKAVRSDSRSLMR